MDILELKSNLIIHSSIFPDPLKIIAWVPMGDSVKPICEKMNSDKVNQPVLTAEQIAEFEIFPESEPFDGNAAKRHLGIEAI